MRPVTPEELDAVDWRGRWINDGEEYDEDEDEDRQMEDFDPVSTCVTTLYVIPDAPTPGCW